MKPLGLGIRMGRAVIGATAGVPVNSVAPALDEDAPHVGDEIECGTGTWTNSPDVFLYQWQRDGGDIVGATSASYTVQPADSEAVLKCLVTARNAAGDSDSEESDATDPVPEVVQISASQLSGSGVGGLLIPLGGETYAEVTVTELTLGGSGALDLSGLDNLEVLNANGASFESITLPDGILEVNIQYNPLTALMLPATLVRLDAGASGLTALDVSACLALEFLNLALTAVMTLDASGLTALEDVNTGVNPAFVSLDVEGCTALVMVECSTCALDESAVDAILASLDANGASNGTVSMVLGTNAAPSAAGLLSKAALELRGWTVTTN